YLDSMKSYSMCEGHYNQVVTKKFFIDQFKETDTTFLSLGGPKKKKLKVSNEGDEQQASEKTFVDFGTQVDLPEKIFIDFGTQVDLPEKTFVNFSIQVDLPEKIFVNFGAQVDLVEKTYPICEILQRRIDELEENNKQLLSENEAIKRILNEKFTNQKDCIYSIIEIVKQEQ
ncbi:19428_t:CDS:2, partial [Racocetra persica]